MDMLNEPLLLDTNYATYFDSKLEAFFAHIFRSQSKAHIDEDLDNGDSISNADIKKHKK